MDASADSAAGPPPRFSVSVASKGLNFSVSALKSTDARQSVSVDSTVVTVDSLFDGSADEQGAEEAESSRSGWEAFRGDRPVRAEADLMAGCKWIGSRDWDG